MFSTLIYAFYLSFSLHTLPILHPIYLPLIWLGLAGATLVNPLPVFFRESRWWFLRVCSKLLYSIFLRQRVEVRINISITRHVTNNRPVVYWFLDGVRLTLTINAYPWSNEPKAISSVRSSSHSRTFTSLDVLIIPPSTIHGFGAKLLERIGVFFGRLRPFLVLFGWCRVSNVTWIPGFILIWSMCVALFWRVNLF